MATPDKVIEVGAWMLENGHRLVLKVTGGRWPRTVLGMDPDRPDVRTAIARGW